MIGVFHHMYLEVTERIAAIIAGGDELDVRFADLWFEAYDAAAAGRQVPTAWQPLFEARGARRWPIQYASAA